MSIGEIELKLSLYGGGGVHTIIFMFKPNLDHIGLSCGHFDKFPMQNFLLACFTNWKIGIKEIKN